MKRDADGWKQNRSLRRLDLLPLVHPLRLYLDAGMGLPEALRRLTTRIPSSLQPFVQALAEETARGESLADALKPWKGALSPEVAALLVAGEVAGSLPEILKRIEIHLQTEARSRKHLISVLTWPVLQALLAMGLLLLVGLIQSMLGGARGPIGFGWSSFLPFFLVVGLALATAWNYRRLPGIATARTEAYHGRAIPCPIRLRGNATKKASRTMPVDNVVDCAPSTNASGANEGNI